MSSTQRDPRSEYRRIEERVRRAVVVLRTEYVNPDRLTVYVHPEIKVAVFIDPETPWLYQSPGQPLRIGGLPLAVDPSLPEDGVVLRYEVVA